MTKNNNRAHVLYRASGRKFGFEAFLLLDMLFDLSCKRAGFSYFKINHPLPGVKF